jgi:hypothetical protein
VVLRSHQTHAADVVITMTYYIGCVGAPFVRQHSPLWDHHGREYRPGYTASLNGSEPRTSGSQKHFIWRLIDRGSYPVYEIATAFGVTEIIEHRRFLERLFYVTDDPAIKHKLGL